jgi:hypothetical protein
MAGKNPQQPELRRSDKGATSQDSAKIKAGDGGAADDRDHHPVPPGNQPGWQQPEERPAKRAD